MNQDIFFIILEPYFYIGMYNYFYISFSGLHRKVSWTEQRDFLLFLANFVFFFNQVDGYPVYSMATPTILGAKEMLAYLGAKPKAEGSAAQKVVLTDLREEAVVYINGTPFVLRELNKPVDTLKHVGITGPVVCTNVFSFIFQVQFPKLAINSSFKFNGTICRWNTWKHD